MTLTPIWIIDSHHYVQLSIYIMYSTYMLHEVWHSYFWQIRDYLLLRTSIHHRLYLWRRQEKIMIHLEVKCDEHEGLPANWFGPILPLWTILLQAEDVVHYWYYSLVWRSRLVDYLTQLSPCNSVSQAHPEER